MSECTIERFQKDVAQHQMEVIRDDGVSRHVRFSRPGSSCYRFDLITWPGVLCYTGDMGTYVFQRTNDMFEFFRTDRQHNPNKPLPINRPYWAEKLIATSCHGKDGGAATEFDEDKFRRIINKYRVDWMRRLKEDGRSAEERRELWEAVESEVLCELDDHAERGRFAAYDFSHQIGDETIYFEDLFEYDFTRFTHGFTWCCFALTWGIQQYDNATTTEAAA